MKTITKIAFAVMLFPGSKLAAAHDEITVRGAFVFEYHRSEFIECGARGRVFTVDNSEFAKSLSDALRPLDGEYVEVKGALSFPGREGPAGVTDGVLTVKSMEKKSSEGAGCQWLIPTG